MSVHNSVLTMAYLTCLPYKISGFKIPLFKVLNCYVFMSLDSKYSGIDDKFSFNKSGKVSAIYLE